ncbi:DASH complex subunit Dam1 [Podospora aff. communis PSN243]|uniref:DASH complex subunit DAM1 n=1 Tax=Podospora aff. communis PSN243 TaxID=3040156 RepID=A0AAV9G9J2_9PEZI|nr:DASH complex subunit Dam1 [Podospora aff. communis PSN243]
MPSSNRDSSAKRARSTSRTRTSRPTTPLRPSSRSSFRESARESVSGEASFPLNTFEPAFAELSDAMADLEANVMHFQLMHESLARFSESFASFLYGLNMNAFCVDFPEGPMAESFQRMKQQEEQGGRSQLPIKTPGDFEGETTFMTTDTSFVDNPPIASKPTPKFQTPTPGTRQSRVPAPSTRGAGAGGSRIGRGGGTTRGTRGTGLSRPRGRGVR